MDVHKACGALVEIKGSNKAKDVPETEVPAGNPWNLEVPVSHVVADGCQSINRLPELMSTGAGGCGLARPECIRLGASSAPLRPRKQGSILQSAFRCRAPGAELPAPRYLAARGRR